MSVHFPTPSLSRPFLSLPLSLSLSLSLSPSANPSSSSDPSSAISSIAASLSSQTPRARVLDAALSLMCFNSYQVDDSRIECLVSTIVSALSSMAHCSVSSPGGGDSMFIRVGSLVSFQDCGDLIQIGAEVLENLERHYGAAPKIIALSHTLLHAILKAAVSSSACQMFLPSTSLDIEETERINVERRSAITKLICFLHDEASISGNQVPSRLFMWNLDPLILKHDISEILRETTERPFLCLKEELQARLSWRAIIMCFVASPTIFLETRALLHSWFLLTGMSSVLNLQIAIISSVLDVLSRPMWWDMSMEMGLKFPFSRSYFPVKHRELLAILTAPITCESFLDLVRHIREAAARASKYSNQDEVHASCGSFGHGGLEILVDASSTWSLLMAFPAWFYFAAILIFHGKDTQQSCLSNAIFGATEAGTKNLNDLHMAAAVYLSWILNPFDENYFNLLADCIKKISSSWSMKNGANVNKEQARVTREEKIPAYSRKLRISKVNSCEKLIFGAENDSASTVGVWLREFDSSCVKACKRAVISQIATEDKGKHNVNMQPSLLILRIPLGILIGSGFVDEKGCELLLHYSTTGKILQAREMPKNAPGSLSHDLPSQFAGSETNWPIDGACLVFTLFDILEDMSVMFFDCEDVRGSFICQMKSKVSGYLLRCVKTLLEFFTEQFQVDVVRERAMVDLYWRLTQWMQKGQKVFEGYRAFVEVADEIARRFSIVKET
ncbi:uncharacterized protein LOC109846011 [Asparagus officinalis]|uniref:uncharacterized protein LOC109846011 n=1 Tax=Asparagus officinalis TaxID=4686 RepID=UPI00098E0C12|nr:uncharacterized protein LOC109846011 [Asparagus officinalis]